MLFPRDGSFHLLYAVFITTHKVKCFVGKVRPTLGLISKHCGPRSVWRYLSWSRVALIAWRHWIWGPLGTWPLCACVNPPLRTEQRSLARGSLLTRNQSLLLLYLHFYFRTVMAVYKLRTSQTIFLQRGRRTMSVNRQSSITMKNFRVVLWTSCCDLLWLRLTWSDRMGSVEVCWEILVLLILRKICKTFI